MQVLFRIVLPLSVPILATIGLFYAVQYWNDYFQSLLYIIDPNKFTLQLRLRSLLQTELNTDVSNPEGIGNQVMTQSIEDGISCHCYNSDYYCVSVAAKVFCKRYDA